jgi:subtilisin family serine protease
MGVMRDALQRGASNKQLEVTHMAKRGANPPSSGGEQRVSASVDDLLTAALERGDDTMETGRYICTYKENAVEEGLKSLREQGLRVADARDYSDQAVALDSVGDAEALVFPEIGAAVIGGDAFQQRGMSLQAAIADDSPIETIEPEYFAFADNAQDLYLRGFRRAAEAIEQDLRTAPEPELEAEEEAAVLGATWGLIACRVPQSTKNGLGIKVAVLDTGMDLGHPDFVGRAFVTQTFVGQPVQDLNGHGTHVTGTACGPQAPPGTTPRYGIGFRTPIFTGKVLTNAGTGSTASVLAGMNWAIANRCPVISMSLGGNAPIQAAYTAAGASALSKGLLIIAATGNSNGPTGAPANSPTIMAVASLDQNLRRSSFSNFGKVEISGPGRDVFSSVPRPTRYGIKTGTSMATPHVSGCAALWAQSSAALRGNALWKRLQLTARPLSEPVSRVGKGLVQAPA